MTSPVVLPSPLDRRRERERAHVTASLRMPTATTSVSAEARAVAGPKANRSTVLVDATLPTVLTAR